MNPTEASSSLELFFEPAEGECIHLLFRRPNALSKFFENQFHSFRKTIRIIKPQPKAYTVIKFSSSQFQLVAEVRCPAGNYFLNYTLFFPPFFLSRLQYKLVYRVCDSIFVISIRIVQSLAAFPSPRP